MRARDRSRGRGAGYASTRALIITLGESLVVGAAANATGYPTTYPPATGLYKFNDSAQWEVMSDPAENAGPTVAFAAINDASPGYGYTGLLAWRYWKLLPANVEVGLVPCGKNSTTSWDWAAGGALYLAALAKIKAALARRGTRVEAIVIDQGVNDCTAADDPNGLTWTDRWGAVLTALRAACNIPDSVPVYYRQLPVTASATYDATEWTDLRTEQAAWQQLTAPKRIMVAANDDGFVGAGNPHYAATGNKDYSRRVQLACEAHPGPLLAATAAETSERGFKTFVVGTLLSPRTGKGPIGLTGTGVGIVALLRLNAIPTAVQHFVVSSQNGTTGYYFRGVSQNLQASAYGTGGTNSTTPNRTLTASDVGKHHVMGLSADLTNLYFYFDNALIGSVALAGYVQSNLKVAIGISSSGLLTPAVDWTWMGLIGKNAPLSFADYQAICAATKAAGRMDPGAVTGLEHLYRMPRTRLAPDWIPDEIGGRDHDLEFAGGSEANLTFETVTAPTWGF